METAFLIPAVLFVLCLAIRALYELGKEAHRINLESKPIFLFIFADMCVLWISWFSLCPSDPWRLETPGLLRWFGGAIFLIGLLLAFGALAQLRGVENIQRLVTTGIFTKLRHPMYVGFISWILGASIYHGAFVSLAIGVLGIISVLWWRHLEELRLAVQFGDAYKRYRLTSWF